MALTELLRKFQALPIYGELLEGLPALPSFTSLHAPRSIRPMLVAALNDSLRRPILLLTNRKERFLPLNEEISAWTERPVQLFPEPNPLFYQKSGWGPRTRQSRSAALALLSANRQPGIPEDYQEPPLVLASARAIMTRTLSPRQYLTSSRVLKTGSRFPLDSISQLLVETGYDPRSLVTEPGQFSRRGGILDVWPPAEPFPIRLDFFGDELESLRRFQPATQRSLETIPWVRITPAREALPRLYREDWNSILPPDADTIASRQELLEFFLPVMNPDAYNLIDFLPENALVLVDDLEIFKENVSTI